MSKETNEQIARDMLLLNHKSKSQSEKLSRALLRDFQTLHDLTLVSLRHKGIKKSDSSYEIEYKRMKARCARHIAHLARENARIVKLFSVEETLKKDARTQKNARAYKLVRRSE